MGFPRQEYWIVEPFLSQDLPNPRIEPESPALAGRFFSTDPPGKPMLYIKTLLFIHYKCNSLHLPTLNTQSIPLSSPLPVGNHKSDLYVCESISVL